MEQQGKESTFKKIMRRLNIIRYVIVGILAIWLLIYVIPTSNDNKIVDVVKTMQYNGNSMEDKINDILNTLNSSSEATNWFVEGETDAGRIVIAEKGTTRVVIKTIENGDTISILPTDVIIVNKVLTMNLLQWDL